MKTKLNKNVKNKKEKNENTNKSEFKISWDSKKAPSAKVFKRRQPKEINPTVSTKDADSPNKNSTKSKPFQEHIKRKQKKDKLIARTQAKEGNVPQIVKQTNDPKNYSLFGEKQKQVYIDTKVGKSVQENLFAESGKSFSDLGIHRHLVSNLEKINFTKLTNVQEKSIPIVLKGQNTLIRSQTGSGKTLAYAVPIIDALQGIQPRIKRSDGVQAIIIVPTRELALQTDELFGKINTFQWLVIGHLCGGENRKSEKDRLRKGVSVLIGTPGRLLDHVLHTKSLKLDSVRCLVLDEADRLLDMGFRKDIIALVEELDKAKGNSEYNPMGLLKKSINFDDEDDEGNPKIVNESDLPPLKDVTSKLRQTILLSATLSKGVSELAEFTMKNHVYVDALDQDVDSTDFVIPKSVRQEFVMTYVKHRLFTLSALIVAKTKENAKVFIFMASTQMVDYHYELFNQCLAKMPKKKGKLMSGNVVLLNEVESDSEDEEEVVLDTQFFKLHGNMDQKIRKKVFNDFRAAQKGVLICTDVVARGIDVPTADCIVQYTTPQTDEDYLHRVGRTGRAGKAGSALIFLTHEEQEFVTHLKEHKVFLKEKKPEEFLNHLCELTGEPDHERAATALQKRYETAVARNKTLHTLACFAYSTWSRFYNSYPTKLRSIFDFKKINLGHYVTSFAIRDTPTQVAKVVRGQVSDVEQPRLNKKLAIHKQDQPTEKRKEMKKKRKSISLVTSEFSSGLEPAKKKKKKNV